MESVCKNSKKLLTNIKLGNYLLPNRISMAALTRLRADSTSSPSDLHAKYYSERAEGSAFVLTECTSISQECTTFKGGCGIFTEEQIKGWTKVCDAVHAVKGRIYLQIWHCGRAGRSAITGFKPVAPSNVPIRNSKRGDKYVCAEEPVELTEEKIYSILEEFRIGAQNALTAGFDGIQLHGANGYLIDQFLRDCTNKRTDQWGGSIENRCRFPLKVIDTLAGVFGPERTGIKISPVGRFQDMYDSDPLAVYSYFLKELSNRNISFVEIMRAPEFTPCNNFYGVEGEDQLPNIWKSLRPYFNGVIIGNNKLSLEEAEKLINDGDIDMASFGRLYIANPDLVRRYENNFGFNKPKPETFYTPGPVGYIDYPKF